MKFFKPQFRLQVSSLRRAFGLEAGMPQGTLPPDVVIDFESYQHLVRRNIALRWVAAICGCVAIAATMLAISMATNHRAAVAQAPLPEVGHLRRAAVPLPNASATGAATEQIQVGIAPSSAKTFAVPAIEASSAPMASIRMAGEASSRTRSGGKDLAAAPKSTAHASVQPIRAHAPASAEGSAERQAQGADVARSEAIAITDFFGVNSAVMLSSNGGETVRTYRVGDALPTGEIITVIDTNRGAVGTNRRTIRK